MQQRVLDPVLPERRRQRWSEHHYGAAGAYLVTIVTKARAEHFGRIEGGVLAPSEIGAIVAACWLEIPRCHPRVVLDRFVLMPNHVHGIVVLTGLEVRHPTLGTIIGAFKGATTRTAGFAPGTLWQRGFHDRILRDDREWADARQYIALNPERWPSDPARAP